MPLVSRTQAAHAAAAMAVAHTEMMRSLRVLFRICDICHAKALRPSRTVRLSMEERRADASEKRSVAMYILSSEKLGNKLSKNCALS